MKVKPTRISAQVSVLLLAGALSTAAADIAVTDLGFQPSTIEPQSYPERVTMTLINYGPNSVCDWQLDFLLSRNSTFGDADDQPLASVVVNGACLDPLTGGVLSLLNGERSQMQIPADASGQYHVLLQAQPYGDTDPYPSDNVTVATNLLNVIPPGPLHVNFAGSSILTSNMNCSPGPGFEYNLYYGNSWRLTGQGAGFTATFNAPSAGAYKMRVRHATSASATCPGNGHAPVNISLNGTNLVADYDPSAAHGGFWWYVDDTWTLQAVEGENILSWQAGELCTHYWLQRVDLWPVPMSPRIESILPLGPGAIQLAIAGQAGRTNVIQVSSNLVSWMVLTNIYNPSGSLNWVDQNPPAGGSRFYRILQAEP